MLDRFAIGTDDNLAESGGIRVQYGGDWILWIDVVAREVTLFASICFLVGGIDDLAVDIVYATRQLPRRIFGARGGASPLGARGGEAPIAIFVPAWDEAAVIGAMLRTALARWGDARFRLYVGTYPNDRATIDAVARAAAGDDRIRLVIGSAPGPTTKADCLNTLWRALLRDEAVEGRCGAVLLHDAEDVVHPRELEVFARELARHDAVQLPVLPLPHPASPFISGHYCDEFAEAHGKNLLVRRMLGAGIPLAGTGCAIRRDMLARIAEARGGTPFDATSLTEDYELGLTMAAFGGSTALPRVHDPAEGLVAVRAYFPATLATAVRQKARWLTGIALAGWDRTGWAPPLAVADHWMRMRDRRATLAMPVLALAYCALLLWGTASGVHWISGTAPMLPDAVLGLLLTLNFANLLWRVVVRAGFVWHGYGWRQALLSLPRVIVANAIALLAARRAAFAYLRMLAGAPPRWDKTRHQFPDDPGQATA
ncbi:glycosyl transferase family protein [Stakelama tenebrarum]|uniref:Glycosyl transferase family protein n=1 Tax=Stakelama tenebrarum TaxID=2711215 RepID=A0A6G6Y9M7_9SPHN|nr:glycosyl transferase family protein [Sphingosinithalassobacter tenebrarum]QIG81635.1 glycosyl transferase family protein [Sphingosinithalassobacter tenebrarum]